jgi:hypothetical protein
LVLCRAFSTQDVITAIAIAGVMLVFGWVTASQAKPAWIRAACALGIFVPTAAVLGIFPFDSRWRYDCGFTPDPSVLTVWTSLVSPLLLGAGYLGAKSIGRIGSGLRFSTNQAVFHFKSRWKEELVVVGPGGSFVLEHPMGVLSVYLPTEEVWPTVAPSWASHLWTVLRDELEVWCTERNIVLNIDPTAAVWSA